MTRAITDEALDAERTMANDRLVLRVQKGVEPESMLGNGIWGRGTKDTFKTARD